MPDRLIGRGADERYANEPTGPAGARLMPRAAPHRLYYPIINRFLCDLIKICLDFIDYYVLLEHQNDIIFMIYYGHKMLFPFGIKPSPYLRQVIS